MKKLLIVFAVLVAVTGQSYAGCQGGVCTNGDYISLQQGLYLPALPLATINTTSALGGPGMLMMCTDCTTASICVSSGTGPGAFVIAVASGAFVGSTYSGLPHCR